MTSQHDLGGRVEAPSTTSDRTTDPSPADVVAWSDDWSAAPRDGSEVLLRLHNGGVHIGRWSTGYSIFGLGGCWTDGLCTMGDKIDYSHWAPMEALREVLWAHGKAHAEATSLQARAEKAERERDEWHQVARKFVVRTTRAEERIAEMDAALKPFCFDGMTWLHGNKVAITVATADIERARAIRAALAAEKPHE